jgi:site-specific recombinase XerD
LLLVDPFRDVKIHRVLHNLTRRYLTVEDVRRLLERPRSYTLPGLRDKAILELLYGTGVRCKECVNLDVTDVDFETGMVLVRDGKGGKSRFQPMADTLKAALQDYLTRGRPHMVRRKADCGALFLMVNGARLPRHQLANLVARYAEQAELGRVTIHMLRHAFAQHLLQGGAQLEEVQQLLGHERIQTTSTYTGIRPVDVKKDHRKSHPRARTKPGRKTGPPSGPAPQPAAKERRQE